MMGFWLYKYISVASDDSSDWTRKNSLTYGVELSRTHIVMQIERFVYAW